MVHVASQIGAEAGEVAFYDWQGRSAKRNRSEIRRATGVSGSARWPGGDKITLWLAEDVCAEERSFERVRDRMLKRCRSERIVRAGLSRAEEQMMARVGQRLRAEMLERVNTLVAQADDDPEQGQAGQEDTEVFARVKDAPGSVSLNTLLDDTAKLEAVCAIGLEHRAFAGVPTKMVVARAS